VITIGQSVRDLQTDVYFSIRKSNFFIHGFLIYNVSLGGFSRGNLVGPGLRMFILQH
jgi:hypothetical protein